MVEFDLSDKASDKEIIQVLCDTMDVRELVHSIAASGFFAHEPLIVLSGTDRYTVIEGNRRLAAVKLLLDPSLLTTPRVKIPGLEDKPREELRTLPAQIVQSRKEAWRYLGFKHVNGPAKWSSFAKSQYIANVYRNMGVSLRDIAGQIGDTHRTVYRLYRGLAVLEQAEQLGVFNREDRWKKHFSFSHLYTGLDLEGFRSFLKLHEKPADSIDFVPAEQKSELGELFLWLYGNKRKGIEPIVKTQNPDLRRLDAVVNHLEALAALRNGYTLEYAVGRTLPATTRFGTALQKSKAELEKARGLLSEGYHGNPELLVMAKAVAKLARDLRDEMTRANDYRG